MHPGTKSCWLSKQAVGADWGGVSVWRLKSISLDHQETKPRCQTQSPEVSQEIKTKMYNVSLWLLGLVSCFPCFCALLFCFLVETFLRGCRNWGPAWKVVGDGGGAPHSGSLEGLLVRDSCCPGWGQQSGLTLRTDSEPAALTGMSFVHFLWGGLPGTGMVDGCEFPGQVMDSLNTYLWLSLSKVSTNKTHCSFTDKWNLNRELKDTQEPSKGTGVRECVCRGRVSVCVHVCWMFSAHDLWLYICYVHVCMFVVCCCMCWGGTKYKHTRERGSATGGNVPSGNLHVLSSGNQSQCEQELVRWERRSRKKWEASR